MPSLEDVLTEPVLRSLYLEEGKTETEIAKAYNTYQVKVSRLRVKYGIPTIAKTDRLKLPEELTPRQQAILSGSMLGDGRLFTTGRETAAFSEHHSKKQRPYLEWKVAEFAPYSKGIAPSDKGPHLGFDMTTYGVRVFKPYWKVFYPEGRGNKRFSRMPLKWVTDLSLAVWFMDDGSRSGKSLRFSVSPEDEDTEVQLRIFKRFGIQAHPYTESNGRSIFISDRTNLTRFLDLVRPHIHPSMAYKLSLDGRVLGDAPRDVLTKERLQGLVLKGLSASAISEIYRVSRQSVLRALRRSGLPVLDQGRPSRANSLLLSSEEAALALSRLTPGSPEYVDHATAILLKTEIPLPVYTEDQLRKDTQLLRSSRTVWRDGSFEGVTRAGSWLCQDAFPHRWDARYRQHPSVKEAWHDQKYLRRAVRFQVAVGDPVVPHRILRALQAVVRAPTNFRPCYAKAITEVLCPEGGMVLDPCAGYGGRAAGVLSSGRRYFGVDPHPAALASFEKLRGLIGPLVFRNEPFEDTDLTGVEVDLVFTSPPYFSVERYADDATQSWVRYPTWESWVTGFLQPLVHKSWKALRLGGAMAINTKTVRMGRHSYPIDQKLTEYASQVGFQLEDTWNLPLGFLGKTRSTEPLLVFRKPT